MQNASTILKNLKQELSQHVDPVYKAGAQRFFKEDVTVFGVRTGDARKIAKQYYNQYLTNASKNEVFSIAETLWQDNYLETNTIALQWIHARKKEYTKKDLVFFKRWTGSLVTNWATCDDLSTHPIGSLLLLYPDLAPKLTTWTTSKHRWLRRAAAVSFIYPARDKQYLPIIFEIADLLLEDDDDLVQKGYGWMLKEASKWYPAPVYEFILKRKKRMPMTALRYALEKYPKEMRKEAMS